MSESETTRLKPTKSLAEALQCIGGEKFRTVLPEQPPLNETEIIRHKGLLKGKIEIGEVFAWEPDKPHARELVIVTKMSGDQILTIGTYDKDEYWNDESRFREACQRTRFQRMKV